jgi:ribosomal protein S12 methylthiotransferase accessory factor
LTGNAKENISGLYSKNVRRNIYKEGVLRDVTENTRLSVWCPHGVPMDQSNVKEPRDVDNLPAKESGFSLKSSPKIYQNYKSKPPEETLQQIQEILQPYFLKYVSAYIQPNEFSSTWYCRVSLVSTKLSQNGKGKTLQLALASGFAEVMERIQILYMLRFSSNLPHLVACPDELPDDESLAQWKAFNAALHKDMNDRIPDSSLTESENTFYRFYDVLNGNEPVYLDSSLVMHTTTGNAAGNTREEAIVQALCELFERYAMDRVIKNRMCVPSIPWDFLSESKQRLLQEIKDSGFDVFVKDLSLGSGLPVVCVVVGTSDMGYCAHPGSASDFNGAVERCLLEFYQWAASARNRINLAKNRTEITKTTYSILSDYLEPHFALDEFFRETNFVSYDFPPHDLQFLTEDSSEQFVLWDYSRTDFYEEIQLLFDLCKKNRFRIYIRDINWMGFPAVEINSPELKGHEFNTMLRREIRSGICRQFQRHLLEGADSVRTPQFYELICHPEVLYHCMTLISPEVDSLRGLAQGGPIAHVNAWYFLGHVAYYFQDIKLAKCFFQCYEKTAPPEGEYYRCLVRFIESLPEDPWDEDGTIREDVRELLQRELSETFSSATVDTVLSDLKSPKTVLENIDEILVPCKECETCPVIQRCVYGQLLPILKQLQEDFSGAIQWEVKDTIPIVHSLYSKKDPEV